MVLKNTFKNKGRYFQTFMLNAGHVSSKLIFDLRDGGEYIIQPLLDSIRKTTQIFLAMLLEIWYFNF